eukprot:26718-Rhodomonas_salina.2
MSRPTVADSLSRARKSQVGSAAYLQRLTKFRLSSVMVLSLPRYLMQHLLASPTFRFCGSPIPFARFSAPEADDGAPCC